MVHLITGYAGYEHITSADDGSFNAAFFGDGQNVMEIGNQFSASIIDNNTVRILDGDALMYGRHFRIAPNTYEDITITTGVADKNRIDLIVATYRLNEDDGTETVELEVIQGTAATSPNIPTYTDGNILQGAKLNQMPLYKVNIEGVVLKSLTPMFTTIPTYKALAEKYAQAFEDKVAEKSADLMQKSVYDTNGDGKVDKAATADTATKATSDGNGKNINSTYAKLAGASFTGKVTMNDTSVNGGDWSVKNISIRDSSWNGITTHSDTIFMLRK